MPRFPSNLVLGRGSITGPSYRRDLQGATVNITPTQRGIILFTDDCNPSRRIVPLDWVTHVVSASACAVLAW